MDNKLIPIGSDLNDYIETGEFFLEGAYAYENTPLGYGFDSYFSRLEVIKQFRDDRPYVEQRLTFKTNFITFSREWDGQKWSFWIQHLNMNNALNYFYPIGAVYMSYEPTHPGQLFGGGWVEIKGVFPYFNSGTEKGGSNTQALNITHLPSHSHKIKDDYQVWGIKQEKGLVKEGADIDGVGKYYSSTKEDSEWIIETEAVGTGNPYNNMPAYQTFYAWRRVE